MKVQNYNIVPPSINDTVFGTANGDTVNFNVQSLLALNSVPLIDSAVGLTVATISSTSYIVSKCSYLSSVRQRYYCMVYIYVTNFYYICNKLN
mgnify:CR=1 FL=1